MKRPKAIIFDLDGTLVDSLQDITRAINRALEQHHRPPVESDKVRAWVGDGFPVLCQRAIAATGANEGLENFVQLAREHYETHCADTTRPYRNILEMLDLLKRAGVPMTVLSNKPHALTTRVLKALELMIFFRAVRGYLTEQDKKPSPKQAIALAKVMKIAPADVLFVGDSTVDIRTARNAGMGSVAVTWGFQKKSQLTTEKPDLIIDDPLELPKIFLRETPIF